jgi:hypothetical protein
MDCNRVVDYLKSVSEGLHQALMGIAVGRELVSYSFSLSKLLW